ncbi:hypothetical protein FRC06_003580 [Ceratobasidium sp. 370]|nr:hypothetical protein FRC06_003580 [Ceratobasidium sp. 370]
MFSFTTSEGVLAYLEGTQFAATDVQSLPGGHTAFTYRAKLRTPLPTGETSIVIKHAEGYSAFHRATKFEAERAVYEYEALSAVSASGLFNSDSIVQVPKPFHLDRETNTIFMTDLGAIDTLTKVLTDSLDGVHGGEDAESKLKAACDLASAAGSALGDFAARFHNWSSLPEQAPLRERFAQNVAGKQQCLAIHHDVAVRSATMFGLNGPWLDAIIEEERQGSANGSALAIGDLWLDNVLVSRAPEHGGLRFYAVDWEMARPAPPEFDVGEITGVAASFARRHGVQDVYPFIPALHRAYSRHRTLDPLKIARLTGIDTMGFGTVLKWAREGSKEFLRQVTLEGYELLQLSRNCDMDGIKTKSLVKQLFTAESQ